MVSSRFCRRSRTFCTVLFLWDSGSAKESRKSWVSREVFLLEAEDREEETDYVTDRPVPRGI
jgi:hypothetical protein